MTLPAARACGGKYELYAAKDAKTAQTLDELLAARAAAVKRLDKDYFTRARAKADQHYGRRGPPQQPGPGFGGPRRTRRP